MQKPTTVSEYHREMERLHKEMRDLDDLAEEEGWIQHELPVPRNLPRRSTSGWLRREDLRKEGNP